MINVVSYKQKYEELLAKVQAKHIPAKDFEGVKDLQCPECGKDVYIQNGELVCSDESCKYDIILADVGLIYIRNFKPECVKIKKPKYQ